MIIISMEDKEITLQDIKNSLDDLNTNTVNSTNSIKELTQFLITQQDAEDHERAYDLKKTEEEEEIKAEEEQALKEEEQQKAETKEAQEQEQAETYEGMLVDIREECQLTNQLLAVQGIYLGIVCGLLFIKILFDRIRI